MTFQHTTLRYNRVPFHTAAGEDILQRIERHWDNMRTADGLPARSSIAPEPLDDTLAHCFVLERVAPQMARFRVAGRELTRLLAMEPRSMPLGALFTENGRDLVGEMVANVADGPHIVELPVTVPRGFARTPVRGRLLMLPLVDRNGNTSRILGAIVLDAKPGRGVLKMEIDTSVPLRCKKVGPRIRTEPVRPHARPIEVMTTIAAPVEPTLQQLARPRRVRPYLRLVVDNTVGVPHPA